MSHGPCDPSTLADAHHCRARERLARMSIDRAGVARGEAGDDDPRRARAGRSSETIAFARKTHRTSYYLGMSV